MHAFTDNAGREWLVEVNVDAVDVVRARCDLDLLTAADPQAHLFERLAADPRLLVAVLWTLCEEQASTVPHTVKRQRTEHGSDGSFKEILYEETVLGLPPEQFGRAMAGDALDSACEALTGEIVCFFPRLRRRLLEQAVEKIRAMEAAAVGEASKFLASPELEAHLRTRLQQLKNSFGDALVRSAATPDAGPSGGSSTPPTTASGPSTTAAPG